jgi:D-glycero-D-manno-heptose 1,7-bisphosphate phosphatase
MVLPAQDLCAAISMYNQPMKPAIFLDRDGVIIQNRPDYVRSWNDVEFLPAAVDALARLASAPYPMVFVTNQSAVGRGIISLETAQAINRRLVAELRAQGCRVDGIFMCPHAPEDGCACRKPKPGLLFQAAEALGIDLSASVMIGDAWTDLQAGAAAGVSRLGLLLTGRGEQQLLLPRPPEVAHALVFSDLAAALAALLPLR